jgi:DUF971 family protein
MHGEQAVAILLELRALVTVVRVFDGERVQVEFLRIFSSSASVASRRATQTKQSGCFR